MRSEPPSPLFPYFFRSLRATSRSCLLIGALLFVVGCERDSGAAKSYDKATLVPIVLQTDWFAQPEHGGFYQAVAKGYYEEVGLEVTILEGGPNAMSVYKVLDGSAHFAMNRADNVMLFAGQGMPLLMIMATLQHDPQGLMLHAHDPAQRIEDLDGRRVMAVPGLNWINYVERKFDLKLDILPHDFGMDRFLNDPNLIQQCLVTNEPYYMEQHGAEVRLIRLAETGFDPYHGVYTQREFAASHPEIIRKFVEASIRGWTDYIEGDPTPALTQIAKRNPRMTEGFMRFAYDRLREDDLVSGRPDDPVSGVGKLDRGRMKTLHDEMVTLGILAEPLPPEAYFTDRFLPED